MTAEQRKNNRSGKRERAEQDINGPRRWLIAAAIRGFFSGIAQKVIDLFIH